MKQVKIAGVPEHFNFPWHLCIENGDFEKESIDLEWIDVPEGTGKMCQMLREETTDIAVILTEGIIKDIVAGNSSKLVQVYVKSPLIWGIHVAAASHYKQLSDLENAKVAISRKGSGSHLMALVNAKNQNWNSEKIQFEIVNTLDGAVKALTNGTADYFMWEHFMTKPLVDQGIFRRIADCPTPWPCFVIAVRNRFLEKEPQLVKKILSIINHETLHFKSIPTISHRLASEYNQKIEDIEKWLSLTEWSQENDIKSIVQQTQNQLVELGILENTVPIEKLVCS